MIIIIIVVVIIIISSGSIAHEVAATAATRLVHINLDILIGKLRSEKMKYGTNNEENSRRKFKKKSLELPKVLHFPLQ